MIEIAAILVSLLLIAISTYSWIKEKNHKNKYKDFYSLPTPKPVLPIIGNGLLFYKFNYNIVKVSEFISETVGNPCVIYMPNETYCTSCPEELKIILNHPDCLEKGSFYKVLNTTFKQTLLIESVSKWKKNRKLVSKGFNQKVLDSSVESFNTMGPNLIEKLKKNNEDLVYLFQKFTLDNFTENFLNINFNFLDEKESEFVDMITNGEKTMARRIGNLIKMNDFCYNFTGDGRYLNKIMAQAFDFIQKILTNKRLELNENYFSHVETKELRRGQLLQLLLSDKDTTDEYIRKELVLLAGAATDTTAYSMAFTCVLLGMHPDIQKKVYEEVINIVGKDKEIEHNILPSLKYTEMAINESLRLLPVIPYTGRRSVADIHLGTKVIPAGTDIVCFLFGTHRSEKWYPNPKKYDPERFSPEEVAKRPQYAFLPFSGGPRNCIGWKYAMMNMKTTIANIVRHFHITTKYKSIDDMDFESSIAMTTTHPVDCHFKIREQ